MKTLALAAFIQFVISLSTAMAQDRYYNWSEQFESEDPGEFELESYSNFDTPSYSSSNHSLVQTFELEYAFSDRVQARISQGFLKGYPAGEFSSGVLEVEGLYRLVAPGKFYIDPVVYLSFSRSWTPGSATTAEAKLILSKDIGSINALVVGSTEYYFGGESELKPEMSAGVSYRIVDGLRAGIEAFATGEDEDKTEDADLRGTGIGPTVSFSTPWFWMTTGASLGLSGAANNLNFRTIIGIDL